MRRERSTVLYTHLGINVHLSALSLRDRHGDNTEGAVAVWLLLGLFFYSLNCRNRPAVAAHGGHSVF